MNITQAITDVAGKDAGSVSGFVGQGITFLVGTFGFVLEMLGFMSGLALWMVLHLHIIFAVVEIFIIGFVVATSGTNAARVIKNFVEYHIALARASVMLVFALIGVATDIIIALTTWIP